MFQKTPHGNDNSTENDNIQEELEDVRTAHQVNPTQVDASMSTDGPHTADFTRVDACVSTEAPSTCEYSLVVKEYSLVLKEYSLVLKEYSLVLKEYSLDLKEYRLALANYDMALKDYITALKVSETNSMEDEDGKTDLKDNVEISTNLDTTTSETLEPYNHTVSLQDFHFVKSLGEGGFGKVVLATGSLLGGPEELYAIKAMVKRKMKSRSSISSVFTEKEALKLTSGNPFITRLHCCFQNKVCLNFLNFIHVSSLLLVLKFTVSVKLLQFFSCFHLYK